MTADIIPFVPRNAKDGKPMVEPPIDMKTIEAEIAASLWGLSVDSVDMIYESTLGFVPPYVAPESDPA